MPFYLQESSTQENIATRAYADEIDRQLHIRISNLVVSFMSPADVTVVVTVLVNFQIQIVLELTHIKHFF